ncbi:MAG: GGDEF domain-containing protein [Oscillospiraceae bacterium]
MRRAEQSEVNRDFINEQEASQREQFLSILEHKLITTVFQPIVSLRDGKVYGYEALSRGPQGTDLHMPKRLFEMAERFDQLWELELVCRSKAIETVYGLQARMKLFLNVNPNIMHDVKFKQGFTKEYLNRYFINPQDIIFEITENVEVDNTKDFKSTVQHYKNQDYRIAIDDAGAGYSGLNMISDVHPHFIKLDLNLIRNIDKDITKQSLVRGMLEFASLSNSYLIAEGIETEDELLKLIEIGVHYGQGYFIQKPNPAVLPIRGEIIRTIHEANRKINHIWDRRLSDINIGNICRAVRTVNAGILTVQIYEMIKNDCTLPGFCVTEADSVVGVITRQELFRYISGQYGYNLYSKKPVSAIMSGEFLSVDYEDSIEIVAKKAMRREIDKVYDFITVTKENRYFGVVTVKDLLEKAIQIEVSNARHLNPLSQLPGNLIIENQLEYCIEEQPDAVALYLDMDNFKAYNDVYGFENGDRLIKCITQILKDQIPREDFIGHIGGDDFAVILYNASAAQAEEICGRILAEIDASVLKFYSQNDIDQGYIVTKNRNGIEESFPLTSISIAGAKIGRFKTIYELSEKMAMLKKQCKQMQGSNYIII